MSRKLFLLLILSLVLANVSSFACHSYVNKKNSHKNVELDINSHNHSKNHCFKHIIEHLNNTFIDNHQNKTPNKVDKTKLLACLLPQNEIYISSLGKDKAISCNYTLSISRQNTYLTTLRLRI